MEYLRNTPECISPDNNHDNHPISTCGDITRNIYYNHDGSNNYIQLRTRIIPNLFISYITSYGVVQLLKNHFLPNGPTYQERRQPRNKEEHNNYVPFSNKNIKIYCILTNQAENTPLQHWFPVVEIDNPTNIFIGQDLLKGTRTTLDEWTTFYNHRKTENFQQP